MVFSEIIDQSIYLSPYKKSSGNPHEKHQKKVEKEKKNINAGKTK
jgi:hypothetical protein